MGQYSFRQNDHYNPNCVTGDGDHLYDRLKMAIAKAKRVDIVVAFLMESGVRLLVDDFKEAVERGMILRILCGNYLKITQPQALYLLKDSLGEQVDLRFYNVAHKSFHPKAYLFEYEDDGEIFVGSSNVSRSALTDGIEWNYRISAKTSPEDYAYFKQTFAELFLNYSIVVDDMELRRYSKGWKRPKLFEDLEKMENGSGEEQQKKHAKAAELEKGYQKGHVDSFAEKATVINFPLPMGAQIEALYELKKSRSEGWEKGLIVAATGVGKTYLAAFDSREFARVLFIAHREEILFQAERTFQCVRPEKSTGFFSGERKEQNCEILFATVQTIGREEYLQSGFFQRDEFDYIVIDEFHHAVADGYKKVLAYFEPKFLLGLTATPERLDNQDVFALCDYNVVYEVRLKEAINKGWLVPFRYYGVFDETTDYDSIEYRQGKYDEKQLEEALKLHKRADLILQNYLKYKSLRALGFCASRGHALFMAEYFVRHGIKACAVISGGGLSTADDSNGLSKNGLANNGGASYLLDRRQAVKKLRNSEISVIFSVDMFNEGLDIPDLDLVMFLRPTESPTVFLQQLGRGLRKTGKKNYVNVLDFIGNYKKANLLPFFLTGDGGGNIGQRSRTVILPDEEEYPEGCFVNYDFRLVNLFKEMAEAQKELFERVKEEYFRIKEVLGEKPLRLAMYTYLDEGIYAALRNRAGTNIFRDYLSFLAKVGEISADEQALIGTVAHEFLQTIENTSMTKMYKLPILLAFYNNGDMKLFIDDDDIYQSFQEFYANASNAVDMLRDKGSRGYRTWSKKEFVDLARRNPMHFLQQSSPEFFHEEEQGFALNPALKEYLSNSAFVRHFKDIIDYRGRRFFKERLEKIQAEIEGA
jgi:superfamily II DNA or RNA helicase/HKD family nuclease